MARKYAGIMALLAMLVVLLRAIKAGSSVEGSITLAIVWMLVFAAVGLTVGTIARQTIDESVRSKLQAELDARSARTTADSPQ